MIHEAMPADEYHSLQAVSNSALNQLARSPYHYWAAYMNQERPAAEPTPQMRAGTLAHCALLEPSELQRRYVVRPAGIDLRTKEGKAWAAAVSVDMEVVTEEQMATALAQRDAVLAVPEVAALMKSGKAEQSVLWTDTATGVPCKARPDWVHTLADGRVVILDLKTTPDVAPDRFARSVADFGYHRQAAFYTEGYQRAAQIVEVAAFIFAAVTNAYPFMAAAYLLHEDALARGTRECAALLRRYAECKATDTWPRPAEGVTVLNLPAWSKEIE